MFVLEGARHCERCAALVGFQHKRLREDACDSSFFHHATSCISRPEYNVPFRLLSLGARRSFLSLAISWLLSPCLLPCSVPRRYNSLGLASSMCSSTESRSAFSPFTKGTGGVQKVLESALPIVGGSFKNSERLNLLNIHNCQGLNGKKPDWFSVDEHMEEAKPRL